MEKRDHRPCAICGMDDSLEHDNKPHCYEPGLGSCCHALLEDVRTQAADAFDDLAKTMPAAKEVVVIAHGRLNVILDGLEAEER